MQLDGAAPTNTGAMSKGVELAMNESDTPVELHGGTDSAKATQGRRPKPPPLNFVSFLPRVTAPSNEERAFGEDSADDSTWPTFVVFTPTGLSAAADALTQDTSIDQEIDSPTSPTTTDESSESSESGSSLGSPTFRDGEAATEHSSVRPASPNSSANQKDEISGEEHVEQHIEQHVEKHVQEIPQPTD